MLNFRSQNSDAQTEEINIAQEAPAQAAAPAENAAPAAPAAGDDKEVGIWSDKVHFVQPLGNPLKLDRVSKKDKDGNAIGEDQIRPFICGYRFQTDIDMVVPDVGTTAGFQKDLMDYDPAKLSNTKQVAAGSMFDLTPFEMAIMASWKEINGRFAGPNGVTAVCGWGIKNFEKASASAVNVTGAKFPRAALKLSTGSIKDIPYIEDRG